MKQAANGLNLPLGLLKLAKTSGCDAFVGSRVHGPRAVKWVAQRKEQPQAPGLATTDGLVAQEGDIFALRRLEIQERGLHSEMERAMARGAHAEAERLQGRWLVVLEHLRKMSSVVAEQRRVAGDLIPRADVERGMLLLSYYQNAVWQANAHWAVHEIASRPSVGAGEILEILRDKLVYNVTIASAAASAAADPKVPAWMVRASTAFWRQHPYPRISEVAESLADTLKEAIASKLPAPSATKATP